MQFKIEFFNFPTVIKDLSTQKSLPLELVVEDSGSKHSRENALRAYLSSIDYMFRGVSNIATGDIKNITMKKSWFGQTEKGLSSVKWNAIVDKNFVVVYDIGLNAISEKMYVADAIQRGKDAEDIKPMYITELLTPNLDSLKNNAILAIRVTNMHLDKYRLAWVSNKLVILDGKGNTVTIDEVKDDESFILIKLLTLILGKGAHLGVFLLDAKGFSDKVLKAFVSVAREYYGDTYIFLHNCDPSSEIEKDTVVLPNIYNKQLTSNPQ